MTTLFEAMRAQGLPFRPRDWPLDGKVRRFHVKGDKSNRLNGWVAFFGVGATFGDQRKPHIIHRWRESVPKRPRKSKIVRG